MIFSNPGYTNNESAFVDIKKFKGVDSVKIGKMENLGSLDITELLKTIYQGFDGIFIIISGKIERNKFVSKFDSFFKGSLEIRDQWERLIKTLTIKNENISSNNPCLLSALWKEGISAGNYTAIVRVRYAREKIVWRKKNFSVGPS